MKTYFVNINMEKPETPHSPRTPNRIASPVVYSLQGKKL